jgi:hypothetical protein
VLEEIDETAGRLEDRAELIKSDKSAWAAAHPRAMKCLLQGLTEA